MSLHIQYDDGLVLSRSKDWHLCGAPQHLVVVLSAALEFANRARHNTRELRIHGHKRILVYNAAYNRHLAFQIPLPYLAHTGETMKLQNFLSSFKGEEGGASVGYLDEIDDYPAKSTTKPSGLKGQWMA